MPTWNGSTNWATPRSCTGGWGPSPTSPSASRSSRSWPAPSPRFWLGMYAGGPIVITIGWIIVGVLRPAGRHVDGRDLLRLPDRRRPVLLVGQAGQEERGQVGVVHRLVQPDRPDRGHRLGRLRPGATSSCCPSTLFDDGDSSTIEINRWSVFIIYLLVLLVHGLLNTFGVNLVKILGDISVWWHVIGVAVIFVVLMVAPEHRREGIGFILEWRNGTGWTIPGSSRHLRVPGRLAAGAVHHHRLRRLGPRVRGDRGTPAAAPRRPSSGPSTSRPSPPCS